MKTINIRFIAWALVALLGFVSEVFATNYTQVQIARLQIQAGLIAPGKEALTLAMAEQLDIEQANTKNLSTIGDIKTADGTHVGGTVVGGRWKYLVRAVGPGLTAFGVDGAMSNPRLTAFRKGVAFASNDDWGSNIPAVAEITEANQKCGAFPLVEGSRDAAMIVELEAGDYTFVVEGIRGSTGLVLLEIYKIP